MKKFAVAALSALLVFGVPQTVSALEIDLSGIDGSAYLAPTLKKIQRQVDGAKNAGKIMSNPLNVRWGKK